MRWARLRRTTFQLYFIPELLAGGLIPLGVAAALAIANSQSLLWGVALAVLWYGAEVLLARLAGWPSSAQAVPAMVLRDLLLPALWVSAWTGGDFVWRGNQMYANGNPKLG